jgi:hypothetical protein
VSVKLPDELLSSLEGVIPSPMATCSAAGTPNIMYVTQVFYVDENHVALSRQFFNKTVRNLSENPWTRVVATSPFNDLVYKLLLKFVESQPEGKLFEMMKVQLEVLAQAQGMQDVFHLQAADIFEVVELEKLYPVE